MKMLFLNPIPPREKIPPPRKFLLQHLSGTEQGILKIFANFPKAVTWYCHIWRVLMPEKVCFNEMTITFSDCYKNSMKITILECICRVLSMHILPGFSEAQNFFHCFT